MKDLFASGRVVDVILILVLIEALAVLSWRILKKNGPMPVPFIVNLLAGIFLMLALRYALAGASWTWIAGCLMGALVAHLGDLVWRWNRTEFESSSHA